MKKQIELLKKYSVTDYTITNNIITINDYLDLSSLTAADKDILNNNVSKLKIGYNKKKNYCFFDGILTKVNSVSKKIGYIIYCTPIGFVVQKGKYTAHGKSVKKTIEDVEFKIIADKLKNEPIKKDTEFTVKYYRLLTGACDLGVRQWMQQNNIEYNVESDTTIEKSSIKAVDLLPILEKTNAYGVEKIKKLISF